MKPNSKEIVEHRNSLYDQNGTQAFDSTRKTAQEKKREKKNTKKKAKIFERSM